MLEYIGGYAVPPEISGFLSWVRGTLVVAAVLFLCTCFMDVAPGGIGAGSYIKKKQSLNLDTYFDQPNAINCISIHHSPRSL